MKRLGTFLVACSLALAYSTAAPAADPAVEAGRVRVQSVEVRVSPVGPVVLLKVKSRAIPVFVDAIVAESIQAALTGRKTPRPLTHDLMHTILEAYDGRVTQVVVTLKERTFYGALTVMVQKSTRVFDSRSSDAIALAIHFKAPILVPQDLLDSNGVDLDDPAPKPETRT